MRMDQVLSSVHDGENSVQRLQEVKGRHWAAWTVEQYGSHDPVPLEGIQKVKEGGARWEDKVVYQAYE